MSFLWCVFRAETIVPISAAKVVAEQFGAHWQRAYDIVCGQGLVMLCCRLTASHQGHVAATT
jgi:hypothetical protein